MKQSYHVTGYHMFDLTECKVHRLVDKDTGKVRFVLCFPKAWEAAEEKQTMMSIAKGEVSFRNYNITEWEEVELEVKSRAPQ